MTLEGKIALRALKAVHAYVGNAELSRAYFKVGATFPSLYENMLVFTPDRELIQLRDIVAAMREDPAHCCDADMWPTKDVCLRILQGECDRRFLLRPAPAPYLLRPAGATPTEEGLLRAV